MRFRESPTESVKLIVGQRGVTFLSLYAPQSGLTEVKDLFFVQLRAVTARIPASEFLIPCEIGTAM